MLSLIKYTYVFLNKWPPLSLESTNLQEMAIEATNPLMMNMRPKRAWPKRVSRAPWWCSFKVVLCISISGVD